MPGVRWVLLALCRLSSIPECITFQVIQGNSSECENCITNIAHSLRID